MATSSKSRIRKFLNLKVFLNYLPGWGGWMAEGDFLSPFVPEALSWWNGDTGGVKVLQTVLIISGEERLLPVEGTWWLPFKGRGRAWWILLLNSSEKNESIFLTNLNMHFYKTTTVYLKYCKNEKLFKRY